MNPFHLVWIVPLSFSFGVILEAILVAGRWGDDE